jgi:AcrR family transcriptional regulator
MSAGAPRPGRPRSVEADEAILRATLELLASEGLQGLRVEQVAERAGVGKATIYRRYPTRAALMRAALVALLSGERAPLPDRGSVRDDLLAIGEARLALLRRSGGHRLVPRMLAEATADPELHALVRAALIEPARAPLVAALQRGVERGELRADLDVELATDLLAGAFVYRLLRTRSDLAAVEDIPTKAVDLLLRGASA